MASRINSRPATWSSFRQALGTGLPKSTITSPTSWCASIPIRLRRIRTKRHRRRTLPAAGSELDSYGTLLELSSRATLQLGLSGAKRPWQSRRFWRVTKAEGSASSLAIKRRSRKLQELAQALRRIADAARQAQFGHVVRKDAVDVIKFRAGHGFLCLRDHHIIAHAGLKALPLLRQRLSRDFQILLSHLHLARGGLQIQIRVAHFAFDLAFLIFQFCPALLQRRVGFFDVSRGAAASPDRHGERGYGRKRRVRLPGIGSDLPILG